MCFLGRLAVEQPEPAGEKSNLGWNCVTLLGVKLSTASVTSGYLELGQLLIKSHLPPKWRGTFAEALARVPALNILIPATLSIISHVEYVLYPRQQFRSRINLNPHPYGSLMVNDRSCNTLRVLMMFSL